MWQEVTVTRWYMTTNVRAKPRTSIGADMGPWGRYGADMGPIWGRGADMGPIWGRGADVGPSFGRKNGLSQKSTKTKMTALVISIDSNGRWTIFYWKMNKNRGTGKKSGFAVLFFLFFPLKDGLCSVYVQFLLQRENKENSTLKADFFPIPLFLSIFQYKMVQRPLESIDMANAVILVFVLFWKSQFCSPELGRNM